MGSVLEVLSEWYEDGVHITLASYTIGKPIAIQERTWYTVAITIGYNSESTTYTEYQIAFNEFKRLAKMSTSFLLLQYSHLLVDN